MENIGDVDSDGYSDIAVSAPYVGDGVVYIFRGAGDHLVANDYQVGGSHMTGSCDPLKASDRERKSFTHKT